MPVKPRILHSDAVCRIGTWHNILFCEVARDIDLEHMQLQGKAYAELARQYRREGIASLSIVRAGVPVAAADARQESARFLKALGDSLHRTVIVLEDHGLLAQMLQTVIRGINVIIRNSKVVMSPSEEDAVASLAPLVQGVPEARARAELGEALATFRAGYEQSSMAASA